MKYTEKIHAEGLLKIFSSKWTCERCPKRVMSEILVQPQWLKNPGKGNGCSVCWNFILEPKEIPWGLCPCYHDQGEEAARLTWLALEAKGYI